MKAKTIVIGLLTDRIDVVLCSGAQVLDGRRIRLARDQDPVKWARQVRDAAKAVRDAAGDMGAHGLPARVLYRGPTACAEYVSPRVNAAGEAASAAILSCADSLSCPLDAAATRAAVIDGGNDASRPHVIVAADADDSLTAIQEMVVEAGLAFSSATPLDAAIMVVAAQQARPSPTAPQAALYVGEQRSFLVIAGATGINFARPISVGIDALINALTRPIRLASGQTIELSREKAAEMIHGCGMPGRTQVVDAQLQLTGRQIVPVLQPVLQRYMVELRQSLRFALPENQRSQVELRLCGPGSRLPGFAQVMSDELAVKVTADERYRSFDYQEPAAAGSELADAITERRTVGELALEPLASSRRRQQRVLQRWLWTGAAAALAMIAFDAMRFHGRVSKLRQEVRAVETQNDGLETLRAAAERLRLAAGAMSALDHLIRREVGSRVFMGAVMQEFSRVTPPSVRLFDISLKPSADDLRGGVSGYVIDDPSEPGSASRTLDAYMQQLIGSPLFNRLVLANVQVSTVRDQAAQSFDVSFAAIRSPAEQANDPAAPRQASVAPTSIDEGGRR